MHKSVQWGRSTLSTSFAGRLSPDRNKSGKLCFSRGAVYESSKRFECRAVAGRCCWMRGTWMEQRGSVGIDDPGPDYRRENRCELIRIIQEIGN